MAASSACVYGWRGLANKSRLSAYSTMRPRYITATRAAMCLTTPRSCAMKMNDRPRLRCRSVQKVDDLRLDRNIERRNRLVANDELGLRGERAGDADALPLAAGELVRVALARAPGPARPAGAARRPARDACPGARPCSISGSASIWPTVMRGLSEEYGSWKMICSARRRARSCAASSEQQVAALELDRARGRLDQAQYQAGGGGLAAAGFADQRQRLARADIEIDAVDRAHSAVGATEERRADREMLDQPSDAQQRFHAGTRTAASSGARQHAAVCARPTGCSSGGSCRQCSIANGQRG